MNNDYIKYHVIPMILLYVLIAFAVVCVLYSVFIVYRNYAVNKVKQTSKLYQGLMALNGEFDFIPLESGIDCHDEVHTKRGFDRHDYYFQLYCMVRNNQSYFKDVVKAIEYNTAENDRYMELLNGLPDPADAATARSCSLPLFLYRKYEKELVSNETLRPTLDFYVKCSVGYTSPMGRNSYFDSQMFELKYVIAYLDRIKHRNEHGNGQSHQRRALSSSLRYDILKRDNFSCVLCGRDAGDGVKLHVDHILPISKGGKNVAENLRTLCEECNLGKGDKYDSSGVN